MVGLLFTYSNEEKEGFTVCVPGASLPYDAETFDEIESSCIHTVPNLVAFVEECYRLLKPGGIAKLSAPHYRHDLAWQSPLTKRAVSELSLNFASKQWRELNKYSEVDLVCDFEVAGNFAIEQSYMQRSDDARGFMMKSYSNVIQAVIFTLTKK